MLFSVIYGFNEHAPFLFLFSRPDRLHALSTQRKIRPHEPSAISVRCRAYGNRATPRKNGMSIIIVTLVSIRPSTSSIGSCAASRARRWSAIRICFPISARAAPTLQTCGSPRCSSGSKVNPRLTFESRLTDEADKLCAKFPTTDGADVVSGYAGRNLRPHCIILERTMRNAISISGMRRSTRRKPAARVF